MLGLIIDLSHKLFSLHITTSFFISTQTMKVSSTTVATLLSTLAPKVVGEGLGSIRGKFAKKNQSPRRELSVDLGGGDCEWTPPIRMVPDNLDLWKTLLVGFPSGDKRMVYVQMESLSGLPAKDDWDFVFNGYSNAPFIKTNYPHPTGVWSWDKEADQVALVIQYIRRSMVEYSDVIWYMSHEPEYNKDRVKVEELYGQRNDVSEFYDWRDKNVLNEIYKWGWYIDYWMENGLYRSPKTGSVIDQATFDLYRLPEDPVINNDGTATFCHKTHATTNPYVTITVPESAAKQHRDHGDYPGTCEDAANDPDFVALHPGISIPDDGKVRSDPKCSKITNSCVPLRIISADKLRSNNFGPAETEIIGNIISSNQKTARYVINKNTWTCLWDKVIVKNEGPMTFDDRDISNDPNFSSAMLVLMKSQVQRLITKYSSSRWASDTNAKRIVSLLKEHLPLLQAEIDDLASGRRQLSVKDIFAPGERQARFGKITS